MRIPNINIQRRALDGMQSNLREMDRAAGQLASGKRISTPSDDPVAAGTVMRTNSALEGNRQYARNLSRVQSQLSLEDTALQQLGDLLSRGREVALSQAGSTADATSRKVAALEVDGLLSALRDIGNSRLGERYIFGGTDAASPPFATGEPMPASLPGGDIPVEIGPGQTLTANHSALRVFGESGALVALVELADALRENDPDRIRTAEGSLQGAHDDIQLLVGEVGGRMARADTQESRLSSMDLLLAEIRSEAEDVDFAEAISRLSGRQAAYEAALLTTSRILSVNLTDYLR